MFRVGSSIQFGLIFVVYSVLFYLFRLFVVDAFYISHQDGKGKNNLLQCNNRQQAWHLGEANIQRQQDCCNGVLHLL